METQSKLSLSQKRIRTLAGRVKPITERNARVPEVATCGAMVAPLADTYIATHDVLQTKRLAARAALMAGRSAVVELEGRYRMWRGALARDVPGFERSDFVATAASPGALFAESKQLVGVASEHGSELPYASLLVNDLTPLSERAEQAWAVGQVELVELQRLQRELREHAARLLAGLVRLRIILRTALGSHDRDYQALRASRRSQDDDVPEVEVDEVDPAAAQTAVTPSHEGDTA